MGRYPCLEVQHVDRGTRPCGQHAAVWLAGRVKGLGAHVGVATAAPLIGEMERFVPHCVRCWSGCHVECVRWLGRRRRSADRSRRLSTWCLRCLGGGQRAVWRGTREIWPDAMAPLRSLRASPGAMRLITDRDSAFGDEPISALTRRTSVIFGRRCQRRRTISSRECGD